MSAGTAMFLPRQLAAVRRAAQRRAVLIAVLQWFAPAAGAVVLAGVIGGAPAAWLLGSAALVILALLGWLRARRHDRSWLLRTLDARYPALEDSSALLLDGTATSRLQLLQQARIRQRMEAQLGQGKRPDFRTAMPRRELLRSVAAGVMLVLLAVAWTRWHARLLAVPVIARPALATPGNGLASASVRIAPPAYTARSSETISTLEIKAAAGSTLVWNLRFVRNPKRAALVFQNGQRLALQRDGEVWSASQVVDDSTLYSLEIDGRPRAADEPLHRLEVIPDRPPEITVRAPEKSLTLLDAPLKSWALSFEARDDYGLGKAELSISLAHGSGEQIKVSDQTLTLDGDGDRRQRRYRHSVDPAALGFAQGDDLIVRLTVADNRQPQANHASSASYILRWPPDHGSDSAGLEGLVQKALPGYFRSERQIIIDSEALVARRGSLADAKFGKQADELGIDQKVLRLRYGQFLGEGFESNAEHALVDADQARQAAQGARRDGAADNSAPSTALKDVPPEREPASSPRNGLGQDEDVLHEYGHAHDNGEATTLLDPQTRRILRLALNEMWQAELKLRLAQPEAALPFEYKALDYIKQVQQAERIYLARAGLELPQVDAARRLSGELEGLHDRPLLLSTIDHETSPVQNAWEALTQGRPPDVAALAAWLRDHPQATDDPLGLVAAADRVQRDPGCPACRETLKARLWPLLPTAPTGVAARRAPDDAGRAYLDALPAAAQ